MQYAIPELELQAKQLVIAVLQVPHVFLVVLNRFGEVQVKQKVEVRHVEQLAIPRVLSEHEVHVYCGVV